jgi:peptide methionine sulfoxide reductase msrA/msrB
MVLGDMKSKLPPLQMLLVLTLLIGAGCDFVGAADHGPATTQRSDMDSTGDNVQVQVFNDQGELVGPVISPRVVKSDEQWQAQLTDDEYRILRHAGTERAGTGDLLDNKQQGVYTCAGCGLPLFTSASKFNSGTGWPSYYEPIAAENVAEHTDVSHGMQRTEVRCARCDGHLGHVFNDGPQPTGLRYCMNSASLDFTAQDNLADLADAATRTASIVLAGGCFWCTEAVFEPLQGVIDVTSGYAGGTEENANYASVSNGITQHAEVIRVTYDPNRISLDELLKIFFTVAHDPTTLNRQGADVGTQYRSAIFYADDAQKQAARRMIDQLTERQTFKNPIVTTLEPLEGFYPAEAYHQDYAELNPNQPYVQAVALPKVEKLKDKYGDKLKRDE